VIYFEVPGYVLPKPSAVWAALVDGLGQDPFSRASFVYHLGDTLKATVAGFVIGGLVGWVVAALMAESRLIEAAVLPYVVGLQSLPKVAKAIRERGKVLDGLMVDGADTRSYLERAKSNAPPSSADVRKLFTTLTMEATQRNTGLRMTRISDYSFSNPEGDGGPAGETTVELWGLECAPEANKQRCRVSTLLAIKEKRLFGIRKYGLGLTTYNALVSWGKDGLESADLRKQALGWMTPGTGYSSSSGNRPGETMEDRFVERDRENRLRFEDSQRFENGVWQQYDPIRRY
jgi:hypothetical protein